MTDIPRRSDPALAGTFCTEGPCRQYARYGVTWQQPDEKLAEASGFCGQHLGEAMREVWAKHQAAAIVQEVPGAWRTHRKTVTRA